MELLRDQGDVRKFVNPLAQFAIFAPEPCFTKDFGIKAHTFPVQEKDMSEHLRKQMRPNMPKSKAVADKAKSPSANQGITECQKSRTFSFTPEYVSFEDIQDHEGNTIFKKGERYNPLKFSAPSHSLLFLDGANPKHIEWALKQPKTSTWLLVKGKPIDLEIKLQRPVYFDQHKWYAKHFKVQHVPARVSVQDEKILVCEISLKGGF